MRTIFVDTFYWIARINPRDQWRQRAAELSPSLINVRLITSKPVLIELLNYFSEYGPEMRRAVTLIVRRIIDDPNIEVYPFVFDEGLAFFESRLDKAYSMTDC